MTLSLKILLGFAKTAQLNLHFTPIFYNVGWGELGFAKNAQPNLQLTPMFYNVGWVESSETQHVSCPETQRFLSRINVKI